MRKFFTDLLFFAAVAFLFVSCRTIHTVDYPVQEKPVSSEIRIVQISDFHSNEFGADENELIGKVKKTRPDIIVITGDLFDERMPGNEGFGNVKLLLAGIQNMCPAFFITGNHDFSDLHIDEKYALVEQYGIKVLHDEVTALTLPQGTILIAGIEDPYLDLGETAKLKGPDDSSRYRIRLASLAEKTESLAEEYKIHPAENLLFTMLLAHRPEYIDDYLQYDFDLILSGHAHGGQWRFPPLINGIYAPRQGVFPKYAGGRYDFKNSAGTVMIVSRGLSWQEPAVPRIFNSPELVLIEVIPLK